MSLIHHAAFDGNIEAVSLMSTLPYFKEIIDDDSNEVSIVEWISSTVHLYVYFYVVCFDWNYHVI